MIDLPFVLVGFTMVVFLVLFLRSYKRAVSLGAILNEKNLQLGASDARIRQLEQNINSITGKYEELIQEYNYSTNEIARYREVINNLEEKVQVGKLEFERSREHLKLEFQQLSAELLKESTSQLKSSNAETLQQVVNPLNERLQNYNRLLSDFRERDVKERTSLSEELKQLLQLNQQLSSDAKNLTSALRSNSKTQGNWGEMVLETVLQYAGLEKNITYKTQVSLLNDVGQRQQPDVIIYLPDNRQLIVDAKVSLTAFERLSNTKDDEERQQALEQHLTSIKAHINQLGNKNYQQLYELNSLEFVFLFMPLENALSVALQFDNSIQQLAWKQRVVLVTPSTLMATLMTVANLWKMEKQQQFANEIAVETGKLLDKFIGLLEVVNEMGHRIDSAQKSHQQIVKQLKEGRGNIIGRVEKIRDMGIDHKKVIPANFKSSD